MDRILIDHARAGPSAKARRRHSIRVYPQEPLAKSALYDPFIGLISVPASTPSQQEVPVAASAAAVAGKGDSQEGSTRYPGQPSIAHWPATTAKTAPPGCSK
jgi:hypothetical protein